MAGGIVVEVTTNNSTELLLPSKASYARNLSCVDLELRSFRSCLRWMCVDQFNGSMQWSPTLSSSSWTSSSPLPLTSSSLAPSHIEPTTWWSSSPSPSPLVSPTSVSQPSSIASSSSTRWT
ncbi:hypothetical protein BHM03_00033000 [Ensete ventricosum]|nr:hypothetical protein BHM03_00033000 [Ensete ventricosum]